MTPSHWLHWTTPPYPGPLNMAIDESCLLRATQLAQPLLRFYSWSEPAATFGYFQRFRTIQALQPQTPLIRRPTGGGLVPHLNDWTYSLIIPPNASWYRTQACESYQRLHTWLQESFGRLNLNTTVAQEADKSGPGQCFVGSEVFDLLIENQKIGGAAQRRTREGLLIQGSLQPPPAGLDRERWQTAFREVGTQQWGLEWELWQAPDEILEEANRLAAEKYATAEFTERR